MRARLPSQVKPRSHPQEPHLELLLLQRAERAAEAGRAVPAAGAGNCVATAQIDTGIVPPPPRQWGEPAASMRCTDRGQRTWEHADERSGCGSESVGLAPELAEAARGFEASFKVAAEDEERRLPWGEWGGAAEASPAAPWPPRAGGRVEVRGRHWAAVAPADYLGHGSRGGHFISYFLFLCGKRAALGEAGTHESRCFLPVLWSNCASCVAWRWISEGRGGFFDTALREVLSEPHTHTQPK